MRLTLCFAPFALIWLVLSTSAVVAADYDPLAVGKSEQAPTEDLTVNDTARQREIPLRIYLPAAGSPAAVVLFSHGLGGSRENNPYLGNHWAARGYVAVFMQHAGSDAAVWKDAPPAERMAALTRAASAQNLVLRAQDVSATLDQLQKWNIEQGHKLHNRFDLERIGMSGHSFGAQTTQAVGGQVFPLGGQRLTDSRIKAAVAFSPNAPRLGEPEKAFGSVKIPWLLMTGTKDTSPIGGATVESRLAVFPALPQGDKYELVLDKAEHSAFGDRPLPRETEKRNSNHHRVILALSTAFWDAYLRGDKDAKAWLTGDSPSQLMEPNDRWQKK